MARTPFVSKLRTLTAAVGVLREWTPAKVLGAKLDLSRQEVYRTVAELKALGYTVETSAAKAATTNRYGGGPLVTVWRITGTHDGLDRTKDEIARAIGWKETL